MEKLSTQFIHPLTFRRPCGLLAVLLPGCLLLASALMAQQPAVEGTATTQTQSPSQTIQPVTTTVTVEGHVSDDYLPTNLSVGNFDGLPLLSAPVSATVVTRDLMNDQFT